jgi:hypothetical protein
MIRMSNLTRSRPKLQTCSWVAATVIIFAAIFPSSAAGYSTLFGWSQGTFLDGYSIDPQLANNLHISGQQGNVVSAIDNAAQNYWNQMSAFTLYKTTSSPYTVYGHDLGFSSAGITYAKTIETYTSGTKTIIKAETEMNDNVNVHWNTNGTTGCHTTYCDQDVFKAMLHEFGHWQSLEDSPHYTWNCWECEQAVMWSTQAYNNLTIDDKEAATMENGLWTEFESNQFLGLSPNIPAAPASGVSSFANCSTGGPDYWTYNGGTDGVPSSPTGGRFMRFEGCSVSGGYAYMTIASQDQDNVGENDETNPPTQVNQCGAPCYFKIGTGTTIGWYQYNVGHCVASLDLEFTDGTTLRDSGLTDQNGVSVHPAQRPCTYYGKGNWFYVSINLSPLAGKTVKRWMVGYDETQYGGSGTWQVYFDDVRVSD